jgi:hypothetical protein
MAEKVPVSVKSDQKDDELVFHIPVNQKEFGSFLSGLLKTPRRVSGYYEGDFTIDTQYVEHLHSLLDHRLNEQHRVAMISFTASIFYEKGRSFTLGSLEEFLSYSELTSDRALSLQIEWTYLVDLPGIDLPQKQVVRVWFTVERNEGSRTRSALEKVFRLSRVIQDRYAYRVYEVEHTHVTLGNDLSNLLSSEFGKGAETTFAQRITSSATFIGALVGVVTVIIWMAGIVAISKPLASSYFGDSSLQEIVETGKLSVSVFMAGLIGCCLSVFSFATALAIIDKLTERHPAFIIMSEKARLAAGKASKAFERRALVRLWLGGLALLSATLSSAFAAKFLELF